MKRISYILSLVLVALLAGCNQGPKKLATFDTPAQKESYALGADIARAFSQNSMEIDSDALYQGMNDFFEGNTLLTEEEIMQVLTEMNGKMRQKQMEEQANAAAGKLQEAEEWLAQNAASNSKVQTTESGLQYEVVTEGTGASPKLSDQVTVHYKGTLTNGQTFDSSYDRNEPATFQLQGLIPAWQEAIPMMKEGGKRILYVHPRMGYGERGSPPNIGPNEVLIFEIELLKIGK
ncbi:MAG: FKBP-type peptidyl-prolyl cis-trans isomerase [Bacteroidia bacterium]|nr:FKBP-type peptidyl-prolyl cis-trans isomerase [Bacteroidia bacterium]